MKKLFGLLLIIAAITMASCSSKNAAVNDLRNLRNDIENYGYRYDIEDWQKAKDKFVKIDEKLRKHDYTYEESKEIGRLKGDCAKLFIQSLIQNIGTKADGIKGQIEGILESIRGFQ